MYILAEASGMTAITEGVTNLMTIVSTMLSTVTGNVILACLFAIPFVSAGIRILRKLVRIGR